ncbi:MAG: hypothetical protein HFJ35_02795 [Clostridia bacterium]|nr:hypothetical protein [Clostridia bacterium]
MKDIIKKWWFWAIAIVVLIIIFFCIYMINNNSTFNNYKNQSISILNDYKKGKITREDAKEKIEAISNKTNKDYTNDDTSKTLFLSSKLQTIERDLSKGELSDTEVNNYIKEIEEIKEIK